MSSMIIPSNFNRMGISTSSAPDVDVSVGCVFNLPLSAYATAAETGQTFTNYNNNVIYTTDEGLGCAFFNGSGAGYQTSYRLQGTSFENLPTGTSSKSISVNFKTTYANDWQHIFGYSGSSNSNSIGVCKYADSNTYDNIIIRAGNDYTTGTRILINVWHHVAVTYDQSSTTLKVYFDGALVYTASCSWSVQKTRWAVGANPGQSYQHGFRGYVRGCRVYDRVIDESVINYLYQNRI